AASRVAEQQGTSGTLGDGMLLGPVIGYGALPFQSDVAMRINQARHEPDPGGDSLRIRDWLGTDHAVDYPEVAIVALRQNHTSEVQALGHGRLLAEATAQLRWQLEVGHGLLESSLVASRLAGWPDTPRPLFFLCERAGCRRGPLRPIPGTPGIEPVASELIILRASKKRLMRVLTSETSTPAPLAIRARREPSRILGFSRSPGVIEWMIASM